QLKVRGFRIEPGEIESALLAHPGVREALVLAREDVPGEKRLAAYLVADGPSVAVADLRAHLAERLPEHMVPAAFVLLDAFPLTPHGKTDRRALPAPDGARPDEGAGYVAPRTEVEAALAEVWAESLGVERVGVDDNYFALGGDSIRSIQLLARARERGIGFDLTDLFRHQTVAELAREVRGHRAEDGAGREPFALLSEADRALVPEGIEDAYPMTRLQLGMVYHTEENPREATYQNVHSFRLRAPFDEARLRAALRAVAERHSVLRTSFDLARFSEPVQRVHREARFPLVVRDVSRLDRAEQDRAVDEWMAAERTRRFDWSAPPLIRCHAHLRAADEWELGFTEHHSILDGWSVASFLAELFALLFAPAGEEAAVAAPPAATFRDFVALEREALASPAARDFWARQVEDAVPTVPPSLAEGGSTGSRVAVATLDGEAAEGVHRFARRAGVPLRTALLAAHLAVLAAEAGTDDVVTGLVSNGRPEGTDGERVLGLFLNTLPFRHRMRGGSWEELARSVFETERSILPFRRFPVAEIQRMRGGEPLFEATFNYVHFHVLDRVAGSEGGRFLESRGSGSTSFPLAVSFESGTGSAAVQLFVEHDSARFSAEQAERLVARYLAALGRMAADPASPAAADLPSDAAGEASSARCGPVRDWPFVPVHEAFAEQAARTPDVVAVSLGAEALTYAELERRSAGLAAALRARGVGPESRVGVCFARSPEMVVAVLAVLRAGAAYVPLDPAYPAERLRWVVEDAGVALALTHAAAAGSVPAGVEAVRVEEVGPGEGGVVDVSPDNLAYLIYTSGSTGRPKGVAVPHGALANHMRWMQEELPLAADDRVLQRTSLGFDASVWELLAPLLAGARLVLAPPDAQRDPALLLRALAGEGVTVAQFVPSLLAVLLDEPGWEGCGPLRRVFCGGEALPAGVAARVRERTGAEVVNLYGPTEACIDATWHRFAEGGAGAVVPIGLPVANTRAHVLGEGMRAVPAGVPGELYLGGAQLARGYLGR
ncbi:MAG TPA: amino acid adenylation domain-containing protein, partial [Longimicrobiaceae bacterium]